MISKAYVMRGIGDALNTRDFLYSYCRQKYIEHKNITIYTDLHKGIFEGDGFRIEDANKVNPRLLTLYGNFCCLDLPKISFFTKRFDLNIAQNARINYSFEDITPLNWSADISHIKLPEKFVTVNYGHDNHSNPHKVCTKMWSLKYWEELVKNIGVPCVQVGAGWSCKDIKGVTLNLVNKLSLKQSCEVMKRALFHIDIEGGLAILNYHIGVKSVVLFGSTDMSHFGKKGNLNLRNTTCLACSGSLNPMSKNLPIYVNPERVRDCGCRCMTDLKPDWVIEQIYKNKWLT